MEAKTQCAVELFRSGFSCSQAVLSAFCGDYGLDRDSALKIACGFCSGVRSAEVCGSVTGAVMVIGLKYGNADAKDRTVKQACDAKVAEFLRAFKTRHRSIVCRDLLGCDIFTPDGKQKALNEKLFTTLCADLVISAAAILEESGY